MRVNGKECWKQTLNHASGSKICGYPKYSDESIKVSCKADAVDGELRVRVHADLNSDTRDESFAIDNVVIEEISAGARALF